MFVAEAHAFISNRDIAPGSQRFWHPPPDPIANLGVRGQGTDMQKWLRHDILWRGRHAPSPVHEAEISQNQPVVHGGGGMGGGGGDPNVRPKPPG